MEVRSPVDVPRPGKSRRIRGVLLVATLEKRHADIEGESGEGKDNDQGAGKEDEHLAAIARRLTSSGLSC